MASRIRIKRSDVAGNPSVLAAGELAYSGLPDNGANGGDRLYIGMGAEVDGDAVNHFVIGGKYFTDMLDHNKGTLTANSAIIVDADSKINVLNVDNLTLDGNTISSTNIDGNITLNPTGEGAVEIISPVAIGVGDSEVNIFEVLDSGGVGLFEVRQNGDAIIGGVLTVNGIGSSSFTGSVDIELLDVDNIRIDENTISSTNTDGDIILNPNGNGAVQVVSAVAIGVGDENTNIFEVVDSTGAGLFEVTQTGDAIIAGVLTVNGTGNSSFAGSVEIEQLDVDNIRIDGNTISSTNTDGNIILDPNGTGVIDGSGARITNIAEPVNDTDAATKNYVDAARSGLDVKQSVKAATVGNIDLNSPPATIDGISISEGDRVLVKEQDNAIENGIYVLTSGVLVRAQDMNSPGEVSGGTFTFIEQGTINGDTGFVVTSNGSLTIGTDSIDWTLFSASGTLIAGDGLSKDGYTLKVNTDVNGGLEVVSDNIKLKDSVAGNGLTITNGVIDVVGTTDRITVNANSIDIASTYVGQSSITTLGTITTGTWQGNVIADAYIANDLTISGGTINSTPIGQSIAAAGSFTTLTASSEVDFTLTTDVVVATGSVTAAVEMSGGLAVAKSTYIGNNLIGSGVATSEITGFTIDGGTY